MKKFVYALFLLLACTLYTFGGGQTMADVQPNQNAFRIVRQADSSGKIALSYIFPVNSTHLKSEGFSETEIKTFRFYLSTYVNAVAGQNRDKNVEGVTVSNCIYFTDVDGLGFSIIFDDLAAQKRFFNVEEDEDTKQESNTKITGFFMKKVELFTNFPISSQAAADDLRLVCEFATTSWCKDNNILADKKQAILNNIKQSVFVYDFASTEKTLKSENMSDDENFHHNIFTKTYEQLDGDTQIAFYYIQPNVPIWYASALVVVIVGMSISYLVLKKKENKKSLTKTNTDNK